MENLPFYIYLVFGLAVLIAIAFFYKATNQSRTALVCMVSWIVFQSIVSLTGFYNVMDTPFPRFPLIILPTIIFIIILFITKKGKQFIDGINIKALTLVHTIRMLVELVLFCLCIYKVVPVLVTFEGRNFDIFSGVSALFVYYFGFVKNKMSKSLLIIWNIICIILLLNVVFYALLSVPTKLQQFSFDQPNIAIGYFPFVLLPAFLVPLVLFSHFVSLRHLIKNKSQSTL